MVKRRCVSGLLLAIACWLVAAFSPATALANTCDVTWIGGATNAWSTGSNWDTASAPTASDHVCIPANAEVRVSGAQAAADVYGPEATIKLDGTLTLADSAGVSQVGSLVATSGGTLANEGTITIADHLSFAANTFWERDGLTIAATTSETTLTSFSPYGVWIQDQEVRILGDSDIEAAVHLSGTAQFDNRGHADWTGAAFAQANLPVKVKNSGTVNVGDGMTGPVQTAGVSVPFENTGEVHAATNAWFSVAKGSGGSGSPVTGGTWIAEGDGRIRFSGDKPFYLDAPSFSGHIEINSYPASTDFNVTQLNDSEGADLEISSATVTLGAAVTNHVRSLHFSNYEAKVQGLGAIRIAGELLFPIGTSYSDLITGTNATATIGTIDGPNRAMMMSGSHLVVQGQTRLNGDLAIRTGAELTNNGVMSIANASVINDSWYSEDTGVFSNNGSIALDEASNVAINSRFENHGNVVIPEDGTVTLSNGTSGTSSGAWAGAGRLILSKGLFDMQGGVATSLMINGDATANWTGSFSSPDLMLQGTLNLSVADDNVGVFTLLGQGHLVDVGGIFAATDVDWTHGTMTFADEAHFTGETSMERHTAGYWKSWLHGKVINSGTWTFTQDGYSNILYGSSDALIVNTGTFRVSNNGPVSEYQKPGGVIQNRGTIALTPGATHGYMGWDVDNQSGTILDTTNITFAGRFVILDRQAWETYGPGTEGSIKTIPSCKVAAPVDCATGNQFEIQQDLAVGGKGQPLHVTRAYNSQAAVGSSIGPLGHGWTATYLDRLVYDGAQHTAVVFLDDGSRVPFAVKDAATITAPAWVRSTLMKKTDGTFIYALPGEYRKHFAADGRLLDITDWAGNETAIQYDSAGRIDTVTDPSGRVLTYTYNSNGTIASIEDPAGRSMTYSYDDGDLISVARGGATADRWQFAYDVDHQLTVMTDGRGHSTTTDYDAQHRATSQTDPLNRTTTWAYTADATTITYPKGDKTRVVYNANHAPVSITRGYGSATPATTTYHYDLGLNVDKLTDAEGHETTATYDTRGNRLTQTDPNGHTVQRWYDTNDNVTRVQDAEGRVTEITYTTAAKPKTIKRTLTHPSAPSEEVKTTFNYNTDGTLSSIVDPLQHSWSFGYNSRGDLTSATTPSGSETTYTYNADSEVTSITKPRGNTAGATAEDYTIHLTRDGQGRITVVTNQMDQETQYSFDNNGNVTSIEDADGTEVTYAYDAADQLVTVTRGDATTLQTGYDSNGLVHTQIDGRGKVTTYDHTVLGQISKVTDPLNRETSFTYDLGGRTQTREDARGKTTTYSYDDAGQLEAVAYDDATPDATFAYDDSGLRTSMTDGSGTTSYVYDSLARLTSVENGSGDLVEYGYDLADNQTSITYPNGATVTRHYDEDGRLDWLKDWSNRQISYTYDEDGNLSSTSYPGDLIDARTYNQADMLDSSELTGLLTSGVGAGNRYTLAKISSIVRTDAGRLQSATRLQGFTGKSPIGYDSVGRVDQIGASWVTYDDSDNLTQLPGAASLAYDDANEMTAATVSGVQLSYAYDEAGNRIFGDDAASGQAAAFSYDAENRLTGATTPAGAVSYTYNADGDRVSRTDSAGTKAWTWDTTAGLPLLLDDGERSFIYGADGIPVEQIDSNGQAVYLHRAETGNILFLTAPDGRATGRYVYDVHGQRSFDGISSGNNPPPVIQTPFGYAGQYHDDATGLVHMRARDYDPRTGQFITRDPIEPLTRDAYGYAAADPVNFSDPSGLWLGIDAIPSPGEFASRWWDLTKEDLRWDWDHRNQIAAGVGFGSCVIMSAGACVAVGTGIGVMQEIDIAVTSDNAWSDTGANAAGVIFGMLPGARMIRPSVDSLLLRSPRISKAVNAYLGAPGLGLGVMDIGATNLCGDIGARLW